MDERFAVPPPQLAGPRHRAGAASCARRATTGARTSRTSCARATTATSTSRAAAPTRASRATTTSSWSCRSDAPRSGPALARGAGLGPSRPTARSTSRIGQGAHARPRGLSLHVADAAGRFRKVRDGLGLPERQGQDDPARPDRRLPARAGRGGCGSRPTSRSSGTVSAGRRAGPTCACAPRRAALAVGRPALPRVLGDRAGRRRLARAAALRPRGHGAALAATSRATTRASATCGSCCGVDDRYVIMNAGRRDAAALPARRPPPAAGLVRDFVLVGDGWVKDGDFNTTFSRTVLPLPTHASGRYDRPPGELEDDPVYRAHRGDFATYHTRYVSPGGRAARSKPRRRAVPGANGPCGVRVA